MTTQDLSSNRLSIVATFLSFLIALSYPSAAWATLQEPGNYVTKDGSEFFQKLCDAVCNWNDYSCQSELDTFKADKTVHSRCKFYYKKGHQVRIEITGSGFRSGTVIVRQTDGSITVH